MKTERPRHLPTVEYPDEFPREYPKKPGFWVWKDAQGFVYDRRITDEERYKINIDAYEGKDPYFIEGLDGFEI